MEIAYIIGTILSGVAAVLAWLAKIYWSKEYKEAKDETIRAKEAQIELLKQQVQHYKDLTPMKIREYFDSVKKQLEDYNDFLQEDLNSTKDLLDEKNEELKRLEQNDQEKASTIERIRAEKEELEKVSAFLNKRIEEITFEEEEIDMGNLALSILSSKSKPNSKIQYLLHIKNKAFKSQEERDLAHWFLIRYEEASNRFYYPLIKDRSLDAQEILNKNFPESDLKIIDSVTKFLNSISDKWLKIDPYH